MGSWNDSFLLDRKQRVIYRLIRKLDDDFSETLRLTEEQEH